MALATLADVKAHLGIPSNNTTQDAALTADLAGAAAWVAETARANGVQLEESKDYIELLDGQDSHRLFTSLRPIQKVTEVRMDNNDDPLWDDDSIVDAALYRVYGPLGLLKKETRWTEGFQNIKIKYDAGYATGANQLAQVKTGVCMLTAHLHGVAGKEGLSSEKIGNYSYTTAEAQKVPGLMLLLGSIISPPVMY